MNKIRIALDQSVGWRRKQALIKLGYEVVVVANASETDDSWLNRAFSEGAIFAVSPDLDIPKMIETRKYPMVWINYPSDTPEHREDMVGYIDKTIRYKLSLFKSFGVRQEKVKSNFLGRMMKAFKGD